MKVLIVCHSVHHGNTQKIAEVMAKELGAKIIKPREVQPEDLMKYDLVGFGSGIYMWRHHKRLLELVDRLPQTVNKKAFVFSTSGAGRKDMGLGHRRLKEKLVNRGFRIVGEFNCLGWDTFGPFRLIGGFNRGHPNQRDLQEARRFGAAVKNR